MTLILHDLQFFYFWQLVSFHI